MAETNPPPEAAVVELLGLLAYAHGRLRFAHSPRAGMAWMFAGLIGGTLLAIACKANGILLPLLASALIGREHDTLESFGAVALQVDTPGRCRLRVAADGEVAVMSTPLRYRVRPRALKVIVPV